MANFLRLIRPLTLLLLLSSAVLHAHAQSAGWEQTYGTSRPETCQKTLRQPDGSYLLIGESGSYPATGVYLLLTSARGRQLWERHVTIPGLPAFTLGCITQNTQGDLLLAVTTEGTTGQTQYLVQMSSTGVVHWMRTFPPTANLRWVRALVPSPDGGFVVGINSLTGAALLYLAADGTQLRQQPVSASLAAGRAWIDNIFPVPGGMLLSVYSTKVNPVQEQTKLALYSYAGVSGPETIFPTVDLPSGVVALGNNEYLTLGGRVSRLTLGQNAVQWTSQLSGDHGIFRASQGIMLPNGTCLLYGTSIWSSHVAFLSLMPIDVSTGRAAEPASATATPYTTLCSGMGIGLGGLFAELGTDTYIVTGSYQRGSQTQEVFMRGGSLADMANTTVASMQTWPNPIADTDELHVSGIFAVSGPLALYDAQGRQVKTWAPAATGDARLSLQGVPPGVYTLRGTDGKGHASHVRLFKKQ